MIALELGEVALSFLAASTDPDRALVDRLSAKYGHQWPGHWLRLRGLPEAASIFDKLLQPQKEAAAYA
jgi:hypothetical protein